MDGLPSNFNTTGSPSISDVASCSGEQDEGASIPITEPEQEEPSPKSGASADADSGVTIRIHLDTRTLSSSLLQDNGPREKEAEDASDQDSVAELDTEEPVLLQPRHYGDDQDAAVRRVLRRKPALNLRAVFQTPKLVQIERRSPRKKQGRVEGLDLMVKPSSTDKNLAIRPGRLSSSEEVLGGGSGPVAGIAVT